MGETYHVDCEACGTHKTFNDRKAGLTWAHKHKNTKHPNNGGKVNDFTKNKKKK